MSSLEVIKSHFITCDGTENGKDDAKEDIIAGDNVANVASAVIAIVLTLHHCSVSFHLVFTPGCSVHLEN